MLATLAIRKTTHSKQGISMKSDLICCPSEKEYRFKSDLIRCPSAIRKLSDLLAVGERKKLLKIGWPFEIKIVFGIGRRCYGDGTTMD